VAQRGKLITLEGGEGAGKSTQVRLLAAWLAEKGAVPVLTREPGGTPGAEDIRALLVTGAVGRWDPLTETLLHYAARRDHLTRLIEPALAAGQWVICDRFIDSSMAYQGYGHGVQITFITALREQVAAAFVPDLTLILDVSPDTRRRRTAGRPGNEDRYERMDEAFHARVRQGFQAIADAEPNRCVMIDANGPVETVFEAIRNTVAQRFRIH
jgi:dTMP kinase